MPLPGGGGCSRAGNLSESRARSGFVRLAPWLLLLLLLLSWPGAAGAMRPDRIARLRQEAVEMFYHGFDNYMTLAFPEDEVCETNRPTDEPLPFRPGVLTSSCI